ncbi:MAG TPA: aminopeptidase P N-terminal domain-containing protein, partial [Gaiellaceae bacterium]|nr:aminopeptidase P N-terminal domain-containing protein [Gaiellaceae bacterium]
MAEVAPRSGGPPDTSTRKSLETGSHDLPVSAALDSFLRDGWAVSEPADVGPSDLAALCARRRDRLSRMLPGERLVVPAGRTPQRGNGQEHRFRPSSDYVYLTGDQSPEGVLVLDPDAGGHGATLFVRPPSDPGTVDFFQDYRHGELWVGRRPALSELEASSGIHCRPLG